MGVTPIGHCQKVTDQPKPREISYGGGVVTIYGEGFSADTFSQFNATKGNKIYFTNNFERVECINPVDQVFNVPSFYIFRITGTCYYYSNVDEHSPYLDMDASRSSGFLYYQGHLFDACQRLWRRMVSYA